MVTQEQLWEPGDSALSYDRMDKLTGLANRAGGAFAGGAANSSRSSPPNFPDALIGGDEGGLADGADRAEGADDPAGRLIGYFVSPQPFDDTHLLSRGSSSGWL